MRAVNLLPRRTSSPSLGLDRTLLVVASAITIVVAAVLAGSFFLEKAHAATARQQLAAAKTALAQAQSKQTTAHSSSARLQVPAVLSQQQPWHLALDAALSTRVSWDVLLSQMEYVVPGNVTVTTLSFGSAGAASGPTAAVTLGGSAYSLHDVAVFVSMLSRIPMLSQVTLVSSATNVGSNIQTFQITAQATLPTVATAPAPVTDTTTTGGQG
jgi:Tfp pilus assembly protein PilN